MALPVDVQGQLSSRGQAIRLPAGTEIFHEGQKCQGFPLVLAGGIRVSKSAPNGRELPLYRVAPGETCIITSSCLLAHTGYNARGTTDEETDMVLLPHDLFDTLLDHKPFRAFVFQLFAERIADLMHVVEEVAFRRLDQRLAALLLGKGKVVRATHQQLADDLGSVREIVSRLLKGFAAQGLVMLGREQIEILDPAGLRRISSETR
ncbi:MAG: Crp/Fnr family transcriptional regulator [Rhodocyclaceae bacterium]